MTSNQKNNQQDIRRNGAAQQGNKNQAVIYCFIFIIGFLTGVAFTVYKGDFSAPGSAPSVDGQAQAHNEETRKAILNLEAEVTANPQNYQAWTRLGNLYYDSEQPDKAIAAYTKSLELHKGDANIITDLGVMYRLTNQPQKAIEHFEKAMQQEPAHLPSRYNKGIVLLYDLNDPQGAIASWEEILKIDPEAKAGNGEPIRDLIEKIKAEQTASK
jgi:tetratricopeptide (TPR) repeat protein